MPESNEDPQADVSVIPHTFNFLEWTNANKVQVLALINAVVYALSTFGLSLEEAQQGAIMLLINAVFALFAGATAHSSPVAKLAARRTAGEPGTR
jgi:hypothetical protein